VGQDRGCAGAGDRDHGGEGGGHVCLSEGECGGEAVQGG
jgi:hypothetical protein